MPPISSADTAFMSPPSALRFSRRVSSRPHGTADDVAQAVRARIGVISRQAVYDALAILAEKGLIRRIQPAGSPARYEDRAGDNHHHLICRTCGRMVDVDCAVGAAPCLIPRRRCGLRSRRGRGDLLGPLPRVCRSNPDSFGARKKGRSSSARIACV